jgi:integral membrane protein
MSELKKFRLINKIEGYSFIILLFVAMPLKYAFGYPMATKIAGMLHGFLFLAFIYQLLEATRDVPFSKKEAILYFVLSLVPFGSFYTDKLCRRKPITA